MITITKIKEHADMCGGISYQYEIQFEGKTLHDVLDEIAKYTSSCKDMKFKRFGEFGNTDDGFGAAWSIKIDGTVYLSSWSGEGDESKWYKGPESIKVASISGHGGWYCGINFDITTEGKRKKGYRLK